MRKRTKRTLSFLLSLLLCLSLFPTALRTEAAAADAEQDDTVTAEEPPFIMTNPEDATVNAGETATFTVGICGTNAGNLSVQWQVRTKSTEAWDNVNPRIYAGGTTSTLSVPATMARNGYEYRCVVKNRAGTAYSGVAKLTVRAVNAPTITRQPSNVTTAPGTMVKFSLSASGDNLSYQWQVRTKSTEAWDNVNPRIYAGGTTSTLSVPATMARNGYEYRCVVKNSAGTSYSGVAKLTVTGQS